MKNLKYVYFIIIGVLVLYLLISPFICNNPKIITLTDTIHDIIFNTKLEVDTVIKPKYVPIYKNDTLFIHDTVVKKDTIIKYITLYLTKNTYIDTILNDTSGVIIISDTIYKNKIKSRKSDILLYKKTIIKQPRQNNFYIGVGSVLHKEINLNLNAGIRHKNHIVTIGYGTDKRILLNYQYRLW